MLVVVVAASVFSAGREMGPAALVVAQMAVLTLALLIPAAAVAAAQC
jgi:hypothetical protein